MFGSSILGTTIKEGMALNVAIGVGVNTGVQLSGDDPFSYVDAIMAGVTSAATTGKRWQASAAINIGGGTGNGFYTVKRTVTFSSIGIPIQPDSAGYDALASALCW